MQSLSFGSTEFGIRWNTSQRHRHGLGAQRAGIILLRQGLMLHRTCRLKWWKCFKKTAMWWSSKIVSVVKHTFRAITEKLGSIWWQVAGSFFWNLFLHHQTDTARAALFADNEARFAKRIPMSQAPGSKNLCESANERTSWRCGGH
jgi:hypothetical protein